MAVELSTPDPGSPPWFLYIEGNDYTPRTALLRYAPFQQFLRPLTPRSWDKDFFPYVFAFFLKLEKAVSVLARRALPPNKSAPVV